MADKSKYSFDPGRLRAEGQQEFDAVALSLHIDEEKMRVMTREGTVTDGEMTLKMSELESVGSVRETTHALTFEAGGTNYLVTDVAARDDRINEVVSYIRQQIRDESGEQSNGSSPDGEEPDEADLDEWIWGATEQSDNKQRVEPGGRFACPECGEPIELPDSVPQQERNIYCPSCEAQIGETPAKEDVVVIDD